MKRWFSRVSAALIHGYSFPVFLSLVLHAVIGVAVFASWERHSEVRFKPPVHITAALVELPKERPKPVVDDSAKKKATALKSALKKQQEARRQAEARKKAEQRKKEEQRQKALALKKEKQRREQETARKREEAARQQREAALKKRQEEERRQKQQEDMLRALEREQEAREQALQQEHDEQQVAKYSTLIKSLAAQYWNRPPSARNHMVAEFRISLSPFGDVLDISMVKSSGNDEFDRSVIQAIKRASPFSELKQLDRRVFDQYFRRIIFRFKPEDLVR